MEDKKIISFEDILPDDLLQLKIDKNKIGIEFPELLIKFNKKNDNSNEIDLFEEVFDDHFNSKYNSKANILNNEVEVLLDQQVKEANPKKIELIKKEVSKINKIQNNLRNEFRSKFKFTNEYANKIYKTENSIIINIKNNEQQIIKNTSIINFHGTTYDGHSVYIVEDYFLIVHVSRASGQSGSLGIWDTRINNWCFTHSDEGFVPCSFNYNKEDDSFTIESSAYYYGQDLVETRYVINKNRELIKIED
jgi:antitoxin component HigA of HigAB toxin-antitoxin module